MFNWHVIQTQSLYERDVAKSLLDVFGAGNSFCPCVNSKTTVKGRVYNRIAGAYRGYTFGRWDARDGDLWHAAKDTKHVVGIMGGEFPWPVLGGIVEDWIERADENSVVVGLELQKAHKELGYTEGDRIRLTYGAFNNVPAVCDWIGKFGVHVQIKGLLARDQGIYVPFVRGALLVLDTDWKPQSETQWRRYRRRRSALKNEKSGVGQLLV